MGPNPRFLLAVAAAFALALWAGFPDPLALLVERWPLLLVALVASAFATATAVGGGFLFLPLFVLVYAMPAPAALRLSLGTQVFGMTSGAIAWLPAGVDPRALATALAAGGAGLLLGTLAWTPSAATVKTVFAAVTLLMGLAALAEMRWGARAATERPHTLRDTLALAAICLAAGLATAWTSIGIGGAVALWLVHRRRLPPDSAIATAAAALAGLSLLAFGIFAAKGEVPWSYLAFTAPAVLIGGQAGAWAARRFEAAWRRAGRRMPGWRGYTPLKALLAVVLLLDGAVLLAFAG